MTVELVAGSNKNAAITTGNEMLYKGVEALGKRAIDDALPEASSTAKVVTQQVNKLITTFTKSQTDKVVEKYKDQEKKIVI